MTVPAHDRRGFLRGLASLPLVGGGMALTGQPSSPASVSGETDPLVALYRESLVLIDGINAPCSGADADKLFDRLKEIEAQAVAMAPVTVAGAVAKLEWARREHLTFSSCDEEDPDDSDLMVLSALDGVLALLRPQDEADATVPVGDAV